MAIEKLPIRWYEPYGIPIVDKINEIIDYATRMDEDIKNNISEKVEQEPNKVELVPLDDTDALANYLVSASKSYSGSVLKDHMMRVLSKYWVPKQKKFTRTSIGRYIQEKYWSRWEQIRTLELLAFLKDHNMLEE